LASRRRYKPPKGYKDGGAVIPDHVVLVPEVADVPAPASPADPHADALRHALKATRHAEELQRQQAQQPPTQDEIIDRMPGLTEHKRRFLRANPSIAFQEDHRQAAASAYQQALRDGVRDDTPEMDARLLAGVLMASASAATPSAPSMPPSPIERTADQPQSRRSSITVSAPVSRDVPSLSGRRMSDRSITLSAAEREIARYSFSSDLSIEERERLYAENKARMLSMRAAGTLNE
jgi:hypothetical protein